MQSLRLIIYNCKKVGCGMEVADSAIRVYCKLSERPLSGRRTVPVGASVPGHLGLARFWLVQPTRKPFFATLKNSRLAAALINLLESQSWS